MLADVFVVVLPTKTDRALRFVLLVSKPAAVAFRVISESTDWNAAARVALEPVNVSEAAWLTKVRALFNNDAMLASAPASI